MAGVNPPLWRVTGQMETNRTGPTGQFVSGVLVSFTTNKGIAGSVFIPDAQYSPDAVKQAIGARVAQLHSVSDLQG
jgi:hypothetical protein